MSSHTPGPFQFRGVNGRFPKDPHNIQNWKPEGFLITTLSQNPNEAGQVVAEVHVGYTSPEMPEAEANARLFAAAPELLAALKALVNLHRRDRLSDPKEFENGWGKAFDAIYLATAENPIE